jgi:hypothetical protein
MVASSWAMRFSAFSYSISVRWFTNMPLSLVEQFPLADQFYKRPR